MSSNFGKYFKISTWGESHGAGIGVVVDGCPAGLEIRESDIQELLDRRKPGQNKFTTKRNEEDKINILSGVFENFSIGSPISMLIYNTDKKSKDYGNIKDVYRPGHADFTFDKKYGFRDYRGGGRSSGRETAARVAAGAIAKKILSELNINVFAYTHSIKNIEVSDFDKEEIFRNPLYMPDKKSAEKAMELIEKASKAGDSLGGIVECKVQNLPAGIGEPVFDKLDANLAKAIFSIGAVKGFEIGRGFESAKIFGSENNDNFYYTDSVLKKNTNNSGGILGGISDGFDVIMRAAFKPTPSIYTEQDSINSHGENIKLKIEGRHDPTIVPRVVVVVEAMVCLVLVDLVFANTFCKMENIKKIYKDIKNV